MATVQPAREPLDVAMDFIKRINSGNVDSICELMTAGHIFQDALGERFIGREKMREGWSAYFKIVGDYQVHAEEFFQTGDRLAIFGSASGVYKGNGEAGGNNFWEVPAAWRAVIADGLVAEWRVYADNQPLRKLMGEGHP
jgi:ketosteroid isomerase-like protein